MKVYKNKKWKNKIVSSYDKLIQAWEVPVNEVLVPTSYGLTHVNVFGNSACKPLILFHGVADDSALMWIYNAKALSEHFQVYAVDTIGGPGKSIPNKNYNKQFDDAIWIDEILDYFKLNQVNIAGVSNGGYLVQYYTVMRNERVKKALSLASCVPEIHGVSPMKIMMKVFLPEALLPSTKNIIKLFKKLSGKNSNVFSENPLLVEHYTYLLKGFNNMAMGYHKVIGFTDEQIVSLKEKCMYLIGESDPFAIYGGKLALEKHGMHAIYYPEVGHGINHEIAEEINGMMIKYFGSSTLIVKYMKR